MHRVNPPFYGQIYTRRNYFADGNRKIDFVLVSHLLKTSDEVEKLTYFLAELAKIGIEFEVTVGEESPEMVFIKLHCPKDALMEHADLHNFIFDFRNPRILKRKDNFFPCSWFHNVTTRNKPDHPEYKRAIGSLSTGKPKQITSWERTFLLHKILMTTKFSVGKHDEGIKKLISTGVLKDAYPIHDGPYEWRAQGALTDRQLLYKYWGSMLAIFKHQPIPLIYKYYGPEVAFHFAFMDFYTKMLVMPAILGVLLLIYNAISRDYIDVARVTEICESNLKLCPLCFNSESCRFTPIKNFCLGAYILPVFDNFPGGIFAVFMGFWSIAFLEMWKRQEYMLKFRWNLITVESDTAYRLEFVQGTKYRKVSHISGEKEPYIPRKIKVVNFVRTLFGLLAIFAIVMTLIMATTLYRVHIKRLISESEMEKLKHSAAFFIMCTSAIISTIVITYLAPRFRKISVYLTDKENPKTFVDYYNACVHKIYATSFVNNYFPFFYVAFIKGLFFTHPGDEQIYDRLALRTDLCNVNGCAYALTISLIFYMALKNSLVRVYRTVMPIINEYMQRQRINKRKLKKIKHLPAWERDYHLKPCGDLFMISHFMDLTLQYGFVTFFIAALQLTPMMALITNIVNLRIDAIHLLKNVRRPVAKRLPGIGAFNNILTIVTYIGTASNAFVIAFTSDLWQREIYRYFHSNMTGYVNSTLSEFAIIDYQQNVSEMIAMQGDNLEVCVYRGKRYPYYHDEKYELSVEYWQILTYKLGFVVIYEQLIWFLIAIVSTFREKIPSSIRKDLRNEKFRLKDMRFQFITKTETADDIQIGQGDEQADGDHAEAEKNYFIT